MLIGNVREVSQKKYHSFYVILLDMKPKSN